MELLFQVSQNEHKTDYNQADWLYGILKKVFHIHHQLAVKIAINDTAVKAKHQINDTESQKFLSRSFIGSEDRRNQFRLRKSQVVSGKSGDLQKASVETSDRQ